MATLHSITRPSSGTFLLERPLLHTHSYSLLLAGAASCLAASGAHPPCAIPTPPFLRWVALSREMPASLALLPRPGSPPPNARCQPPCPYSPIASRRGRLVSRSGENKGKSAMCEPSTLHRAAWSRPTHRQLNSARTSSPRWARTGARRRGGKCLTPRAQTN